MTINATGRHPSTVHIARFFDYEHLSRDDLRAVSRLVHDCVAAVLEEIDEDNPELTAGLRKMLEAKDCLVRAAL